MVYRRQPNFQAGRVHRCTKRKGSAAMPRLRHRRAGNDDDDYCRSCSSCCGVTVVATEGGEEEEAAVSCEATRS